MCSNSQHAASPASTPCVQTPSMQHPPLQHHVFKFPASRFNSMCSTLSVCIAVMGTPHMHIHMHMHYPCVQLSPADLSVHIAVIRTPHMRPPRWHNPWHAGSFVKLGALAMTEFDVVIVLDIDCVVLRNIDHLSRAPTPSFAYQVIGRDVLVMTGIIIPSHACRCLADTRTHYCTHALGVCMCVHVCICVHACMRACVHASMRPCVHL
jgi:hypothetical protein